MLGNCQIDKSSTTLARQWQTQLCWLLWKRTSGNNDRQCFGAVSAFSVILYRVITNVMTYLLILTYLLTRYIARWLATDVSAHIAPQQQQLDVYESSRWRPSGPPRKVGSPRWGMNPECRHLAPCCIRWGHSEQHSGLRELGDDDNDDDKDDDMVIL